MIKKMISIMLIVSAAILVNAGSIVFGAEILSAGEHNCLYMNTWSAAAYIPNTVSSNDTIASMPFAVVIYEYAPNGCSNPGNTLTRIQAKLSYDDTKWRFVGAEPTANWPNDLNWDTVNNDNGDDYIRLYFTLGDGVGVPAPTHIAVSYATLKFVPLCQPELSFSGVYAIWDADHFNQIDIDGNTWWLAEMNGGGGGELLVNNYSSMTTLGDQTVSRFGN